ncbi:hypothetical protein J4E86_004099 [Alternaria arbusti]|uniref:uncharacterized protein n=1 Tax=Alternaria arbusti TaxID=232088 RepID=UPI00222019E1|nr:uncharacterized protein J4E86_004099 [Alternaria arbusti]KAI4958498.1 hypothetical protein J4E86_004099 [Alternaria arbusti]
MPSLSDRLASLSMPDTDESDTISEEPFNNLTPVYIDFDDMEVQNEFFLAIEIFMEDVFYIESIWTSYKHGMLENNVCSLLTNTAIDVVRLAERQFALLLRRPKRFPADVFPVWKLPALLYYKWAPGLEEKFTYEEFADMRPFKHDRRGVEDESDFALFSVFSGLKWYLYATPEGGINKLDPARFRRPGDNWHPHLPRVAEMCHLMQWQTHIKQPSISKGKYDSIAEDEIVRGVRHMVEHKEIPIWVQFAAQIYIDIQNVLGDRLDAPLDELKMWVQVSHQRLNEFLCDNDEIDMWNWTSEKPFTKPIKTLEQHHVTAEAWVRGDVFTATLQEIHLPHLSRYKRENHALLRRHPLGCGVLQYSMFQDLHEYGLQFQTATDCIRPMIYLYAATRLLSEDSPAWPDMELLILRQNPERLFFGKNRPTDYREALTFFEWVCDMSPMLRSKEATKDSREQHDSERVRRIVDPSILKDVFLNRFNHPVSSDNEVDSMVSKWIELVRSEEGMTQLLRQLNLDPSADAKTIKVLQARAQNNRSDAIPSQLSQCMGADAIDLHFDWLALHNKCAKMWARIYSRLVESKRSLYFDPNEFRKAHRPQVCLVAQILLEALEAFDYTQDTTLQGRWFTYGYGLRTVAAVLDEMIKTPVTPTRWGTILEGDLCICTTMVQASATAQKVYYPGCFYEESGPGNMKMLYRGWDKMTLKSLNSIKLAKYSRANLGKVLQERHPELHKQRDGSERMPRQTAQNSTEKKPKNQKKKGKGTTF